MAIVLSVDQRYFDGAIQVSISDDEAGIGYRLAGPKYDGHGKSLLRRALTTRDAEEIMAYLCKVKGSPPTPQADR